MAWNVDYDSAMNSVIYNKKKKQIREKKNKKKFPKKQFFFNFENKTSDYFVCHYLLRRTLPQRSHEIAKTCNTEILIKI